MRLLSTLFIFIGPLCVLELLGFAHARPLAILVSVAIAWIFEIIPVGITALLVPVLGCSLGLLDSKRAFESFGADIIFLIVSVCLLARAFENTHLGKRLAYSVLTSRFAAHSLRHGVYSLTFVAWLIGMWMVNSAVCSILLPIVVGILTVLKPQLSEAEYSVLSKRMLFLCSVTPGLSGLATPVGAAPNLFAFRYLSDHGSALTFSSWILYAAPVSTLLVLASVFILDYLYPVPHVVNEHAQRCFIQEKEALGALSYSEKVVLSVFFILVTLWLLPPTLPLLFSLSPPVTNFLKLLTPTTVGVLSIVPLFLMGEPNSQHSRILCTRDLQFVDLNTILLFGGGLTLGGILETSGLARDVAMGVGGLVHEYPLLSGTAIVMLTLLISEFCSNTAAIAVVLPLVGSFSTGTGSGVDATRLALLVLFAGTLGFSLPAGTIPNGLVYATGKLAVKDMVKTGVCIDVMGVVLILVVLEFLYPLLGVF